MRFLLDSNAVITLVNYPTSQIARRVRHERSDDIGISSIVAHEIYYGAFKSRRAALNVAVFDAMVFPMLDFGGDDARRAGVVRAELAARGTPIGPYDVLIAGQALARDLILVTHNTREFSRVSGLRIEDWEA
ncbi:MAG TPA: type II toxin-antitoxin system VapC family toxin [Stellaceae bacterium]|jgi:tRNA(fMet)-specific endonuclease VapC|nr:type II toxin-antitoxin system VapC family toxin [Stellaceae bacterium]